MTEKWNHGLKKGNYLILIKISFADMYPLFQNSIIPLFQSNLFRRGYDK
jgi:hypothetical protein